MVQTGLTLSTSTFMKEDEDCKFISVPYKLARDLKKCFKE